MKLEKSSPNLQVEVIYAGLCMHCGACGAYCSHMEYDETGKPVNIDVCNEVVGLCYNSCPRAYLDLADLDKRKFGKVREDELFGVYQKIVMAEGKKEPDIIAALVEGAFKAGLVKCAVVPKKASQKPPNNVPVVVENAKEAGKHIPQRGNQAVGPLLTGINDAHEKGFKKIGFVGNPCHLQAIGKQANSSFATPSDDVTFSVGLMCMSGGLSSCKFCIDYTAEYSDVSVGPGGIIVVRSFVGEKALENSGLKVGDASEEALAKVKKFATNKKSKNLMNVLGSKKATVGYARLSGGTLKSLLS
ncbi:MAG: hypothetical protein ACTSU5_10215 [Promethearchaeota archaeon]